MADEVKLFVVTPGMSGIKSASTGFEWQPLPVPDLEGFSLFDRGSTRHSECRLILPLSHPAHLCRSSTKIRMIRSAITRKPITASSASTHFGMPPGAGAGGGGGTGGG